MSRVQVCPAPGFLCLDAECAGLGGGVALAEKQIAPENIVSVIFQPAGHMAIGDYEAKYRVIYRV